MKKSVPFFGIASFLVLFSLTFNTACKKDDCDHHPPGDTLTNQRCDTLHPVIFCHGFLASGDTWANQVMRFNANGYCDNLLYAFDWNTLAQGADNNALLDAFIDTVLARTGALQVDLVGHSAGGGLGYGYCENPARAAKVAHYVHIGSSSQSSVAGSADEVPTLNISSAGDEVAGATTITGATNVELANQDHYQVATSAEAFEAMYKFFNGGQAPATTAITVQGAEIKVSGKALTLGENSPHANATVKIFEVNPATGARLSASPNWTLTTNTEGLWGPQTITANTKYEFEIVSGVANDRVIHYYREGFIHNNPLVYLRTIPASGLAGTLLSGLPKDDGQSVLALFTASQATVAGRDSLHVNNVELSTAAITPASKTVIAMFLYDDNNNQQTDLSQPFLFSIVSQFLTARDMFFSTSPASAIPLRFNGRTLHVPNLKSNSEGVIVAVFD